jgi:hypothetical protein
LRIRWAILLLPVALVAADDAARWWSHVEYLASDALEGRNTGSEGHRKAAEYVASQFAQAGLKPAGENGSFIQPVSFLTKQLDESASSLALRTSAGTKNLRLGDEAIIRTSVDPASSLDAELVFVGYGLKIPELHHDDFAGIDTKGKVAVYLGGAPASVPCPGRLRPTRRAPRSDGRQCGQPG